MVAVILKRRLGAAINLHDMLNVLYNDHRMGTTSIEAKLFQQLTEIREEVLCKIFIDLHKA